VPSFWGLSINRITPFLKIYKITSSAKFFWAKFRKNFKIVIFYEGFCAFLLSFSTVFPKKAQKSPYNNSDYNAVYYYNTKFQDVKGFFQKNSSFFNFFFFKLAKTEGAKDIIVREIFIDKYSIL
jgi:hypothetical protein